LRFDNDVKGRNCTSQFTALMLSVLISCLVPQAVKATNTRFKISNYNTIWLKGGRLKYSKKSCHRNQKRLFLELNWRRIKVYASTGFFSFNDDNDVMMMVMMIIMMNIIMIILVIMIMIIIMMMMLMVVVMMMMMMMMMIMRCKSQKKKIFVH